MNIRLYIAVTDPMEQLKVNLIYGFSNYLNSHFQEMTYGKDVKNIEIGLIMAFVKKDYEDWYKPKRATYISYKKARNRLTGEMMETEKTLRYDIKFDDQKIINYTGGNNDLSKKLLADEIKFTFEIG